MKRALALLAMVVVLWFATSFFLLPKLELLEVHIPRYQTPPPLLKPDQGWSDSQRVAFHYTPQGTVILPAPWFLALEQPCLWLFGCDLFSDPQYLARFGFLRGDEDPQKNPHGLPVGFAKQNDFRNPITGTSYPVIGFNCAACHTGEVHYQNTAVRIEGGPAMINLDQFLKAIGIALALTDKLPFRYRRFERRVLGAGATAEQKAALRQEFDALLAAGVIEAGEKQKRGIENYPEGFARTDALARIGNIVFARDMQNWNNLSPTTAPVRFPAVWDASWFTWVQYNASISNPMARNIGEALGVQAPAKLYGCCAEKLASSVTFQSVWDLELLLRGDKPYGGLTSPKWPGVFPPLDQGKVARGRDLYKKHCEHCHLPPVDELQADLRSGRPKYWEARRKDPAKPGDLVYLLKVRDDIPVDHIGTDPNQALDFYHRTADSGDLKKGCLTAAQGLDYVTRTMASQFYDSQKFPNAIRWEWSGFQDPNQPGIRATLIYRPRPLNGVWAVAPFLHNGSVPNLYELLSPHKERSSTFWLGSKRYDPVKVGYEAGEIRGGFRYEVTQPGNSNRGHEFDQGRGPGIIGPWLPEADRWALIEFLKSQEGGPASAR